MKRPNLRRVPMINERPARHRIALHGVEACNKRRVCSLSAPLLSRLAELRLRPSLSRHSQSCLLQGITAQGSFTVGPVHRVPMINERPARHRLALHGFEACITPVTSTESAVCPRHVPPHEDVEAVLRDPDHII